MLINISYSTDATVSVERVKDIRSVVSVPWSCHNCSSIRISAFGHLGTFRVSDKQPFERLEVSVTHHGDSEILAGQRRGKQQVAWGHSSKTESSTFVPQVWKSKKNRN